MRNDILTSYYKHKFYFYLQLHWEKVRELYTNYFKSFNSSLYLLLMIMKMIQTSGTRFLNNSKLGQNMHFLIFKLMDFLHS